MSILAPISAGELVDKITILRVKAERIGDSVKEANVRKELALLEGIAANALTPSAELDALTVELTAINAALWDIEDGKRACERSQTFGPEFVELARRVYMDNDKRAAVKRQINALTGSDIVEEKSYKPY
ncbi:hypothetical protein CFHF_05160 [Caulobacter flavus]|uniref:Uncharacterized protein n=1 Tax=Caulobacter flavus TaxID=1679497 RepID=A0A2N5CXD2_9CAUL|nr:DUF6165 family protein [Caulobacter flavus]AYV47969.1 hypothetical protein C1707_17830 [Caulobacter flavus]PLR18468.1 hypothetical protein CFHF_05160 [Caulobacter flavus]